MFPGLLVAHTIMLYIPIISICASHVCYIATPNGAAGDDACAEHP